MNNKIKIASLLSGIIMGMFFMALIDQQINGFNYQDRILFHYWALQNTDPLDYFILDEIDDSQNTTKSEYQNRFDIVK